ncbi:MAG: recombinase family protein [Limisphaerales bacterium]
MNFWAHHHRRCNRQGRKSVFTLYINGKSCVGIAKILNVEKKQRFGPSRKSETTMKSKAHWHNTTARNVLTNKSLTGWCKINDFESGNYYSLLLTGNEPYISVQNLIYRLNPG